MKQRYRISNSTHRVRLFAKEYHVELVEVIRPGRDTLPNGDPGYPDEYDYSISAISCQGGEIEDNDPRYELISNKLLNL